MLAIKTSKTAIITIFKNGLVSPISFIEKYPIQIVKAFSNDQNMNHLSTINRFFAVNILAILAKIVTPKPRRNNCINSF
ncbi:hypothetical protein ACFLZF_00330 [Nanoarchaeota archaeon]